MVAVAAMALLMAGSDAKVVRSLAGTTAPSPSKWPSGTLVKAPTPSTKAPTPSPAAAKPTPLPPTKTPAPAPATKTPTPAPATRTPAPSPSPSKALFPTPAGTSPARAPAPAGAAGQAVTIAGPLSVLDTHQSLMWVLNNLDNGRMYRLPYQPMDEDGVLIDVGARVELTCTPSADEIRTCIKISAARITSLAAAAPIATDVKLSLLIMVVSFTGSCSRSAPYSVAQIDDMFFGSDGYATMFDQCSYGQMKIDTATSKIISTPVACTSAMNKCNEDAIAEAAEVQAAKLLGGEDALSSYSHYVYVLPSGMTNPCGWMGLASLPGWQVWLQSTTDGVANRGTAMQELLHNFGLYHSWKKGVEYDDYSTAMGWGDSCPNAYEIGHLRWAKPAAVWKGADLPAGVFKTVTLPATWVGPNGAFAKVQPDWLGNAWQSNVYVALRGKAKGDEVLLPQFDGKLNIHHVAAGIDDNPKPRQVRDPRVEILGTVATNEQMTLSDFKLVVRGGDKAADGTRMVARICRYIKTSSECKFSDGTVKPSPSPAPAKKSPPPPPDSEPEPEDSPPDWSASPPEGVWENLTYPPPSGDNKDLTKPCNNCEYDPVDPDAEDDMYGCYNGINIAGKLLKKDTTQKTYKDCRALCAKTPQCEVAVFSADGKTCILRSSAFVGPDGTNAPSKDVMTSCLVTTNNGVWSCSQHTTLPGEMLTARQSTLMGCQRDCYYDDFCTFFLYTASGNRCILMADLFKGDGYCYQTNPDPQVLVGCVLAAEYTGADDTTLGFSPSSIAKLPSKAVNWPRGNARRRLA